MVSCVPVGQQPNNGKPVHDNPPSVHSVAQRSTPQITIDAARIW